MELTRVAAVARGQHSNPAGASRPAAASRTDRADIPAAVAEPVLDLVTGPLRPATVLAVHSAAVILGCDPPAAPAGDAVTRVVTVLAAEGSGVPNGVRTMLHSAGRPFEHLAPGAAAFVGARSIRLPGLQLRGVRIVRTGVPLVPASPAAVTTIARAARGATRGIPEQPVLALAEALATGCPARLRAAVTALVGLGLGSTPGGDDVLCGTLAGLHATGRRGLAEQVAVAALDQVASRTPLVSADLLRLAACRHACAEALAVVRAAAAGQPTGALLRALDRLLAVGHTSGADLTTGLALGLGTPALAGRATGPTPS